jgi:hypothetical protein
MRVIQKIYVENARRRVMEIGRMQLVQVKNGEL